MYKLCLKKIIPVAFIMYKWSTIHFQTGFGKVKREDLCTKNTVHVLSLPIHLCLSLHCIENVSADELGPIFLHLLTTLHLLIKQNCMICFCPQRIQWRDNLLSAPSSLRIILTDNINAFVHVKETGACELDWSRWHFCQASSTCHRW